MLEENSNLNQNSQPSAVDNTSSNNTSASNVNSQVAPKQSEDLEVYLDIEPFWRSIETAPSLQENVPQLELRGEPADLSDDEQ